MSKITGYLIGFACLFTLPCFSQVTQDNLMKQILVKILYNEKETTIPAISPFYDCYYEWDVLRAYLDKKVNQPSASPQVL